MEVPDFKNKVWDFSRKLAESINHLYEPVIEKCGLTLMQARILIQLQQCGAHTIGSLGKSTCVAGANTSAMCKKLEGQGLVERIRDQEDERVVKVALTQLGEETVSEIDQILNNRLSQYLLNEKKEDMETIILGLQKLNDLLQRISRDQT